MLRDIIKLLPHGYAWLYLAVAVGLTLVALSSYSKYRRPYALVYAIASILVILASLVLIGQQLIVGIDYLEGYKTRIFISRYITTPIFFVASLLAITGSVAYLNSTGTSRRST